ncbi:MAG: hypothetical protein J6Q15_02100, partial [Clostridia bacterium]|nr:hypothetical protein [Clostridia bacterium]
MKSVIIKILAIIYAFTLCLGVFSACGEDPHTHSYATLKFNTTNHWYECSCGEKKNVQAHQGGTATETQIAVCTVCSQAYGSLLVPGHTHEFN